MIIYMNFSTHRLLNK